MTKIVYYCDLHQGPRKEATDDTDVLLHGHYALDMNMAVMTYAAAHKFDHVIHGGDESTFVLDPERPDHHLQRAQVIRSTMNYTDGDLHRIIGNHDPIPHLDILGFRQKSYAVNHRNHAARLLVCQPTIGRMEDGRTRYTYDSGNILQQICGWQPTTKKNLIVASHWAFDRMERGYPQLYNIKGYAYEDNTKPLKGRFAELAGGDHNRVVTLHGHEHRFNLSAFLGFQCLVMPSVIQADIDVPEKPCGLFVEIDDENPDHSLRLTFKKIHLNEENPETSKIDTVPLDYMQRYYRPVARHLFVA